MTINGTAGNDTLRGTGGSDTFDLGQGGHDTARGLGSGDTFNMGGAFDAKDHIYGGDGYDILNISASTSVVLGAKTMTGIDEIQCTADIDLFLTFNDANIAAGQTLYVVAAGIGADNHLLLDGRAETNGNFNVSGGQGGDSIVTGAGNDVIGGNAGDDDLGPGSGEDHVYGGDGNDTIIFDTGQLDPGDRIDGGAGDDSIILVGDYSGGFKPNAHTFVNIDKIVIENNPASLTLAHASLSQTSMFTVDGQGSLQPEHIDGSGQKHYDGYDFIGGFGNDVLIGAGGNDHFAGYGGADRMTGGAGGDAFYYYEAFDSWGLGYDTIVKFDADSDTIQAEYTPTPGQIEGIDPEITHGRLRAAHLDHDLEQAIGAGRLGDYAAVLFAPARGDLKGELFLVLDVNGQAGYQAEADIVIRLEHAQHMSDFSLANF